MDINERIFSLLSEQNKTAKEFCKYIDVAESSVSAWKTKKSYPSSKHIIRISEFLEVSIEYLFTGIDRTVTAPPLLADDEMELLDTYKKLDRRGQHRVHTVIYEEIDRIKRDTSAKDESKRIG